MARIRSIKPDFFTSDDICSLSPLARLLYIGMWCEADREGRFLWSPKTLKRRYLPDDDCEIEYVCKEILGRDLVRIYGEADEYAYIPSFHTHQRPNPREAQSEIPPPDIQIATAANQDLHASNPDLNAQVGREGKGKEGNGCRVPTHASALPDDWMPTDEDRAWAEKARPDLTTAMIDAETERFRNHANANARTAIHWGPNWRNWISKADAPKAAPLPRGAPAPFVGSAEPWEQRLRGYRPGATWWKETDWGPRPETGRCRAPKELVERYLGSAA